MDRYLEAFDAAEQARIQGDNAKAVLLYAEAASLAEYSSAADPVALHHMWGVALISLGLTDEALGHLNMALSRANAANDFKLCAAIDRDMARANLMGENPSVALDLIVRSLFHTPREDLAERGASIGVKARILFALGRHQEALELFGTADVLLQRSENRHYELYNLLHFMETVIEHCDIYGGDDRARNFLQNQWKRLRTLAVSHGGRHHREQAERIATDIFADVEG